MSIPIPGQPVRGSKSGAPIMALFDLLGRRWAMGIIWNLGDNPTTFRELQTRCESISPTILNSRIKELREAGIVDHNGGGYCLTPSGVQLLKHLKPLGKWARDWGTRMDQKGQSDGQC